MATNLKFTGM